MLIKINIAKESQTGVNFSVINTKYVVNFWIHDTEVHFEYVGGDGSSYSFDTNERAATFLLAFIDIMNGKICERKHHCFRIQSI